MSSGAKAHECRSEFMSELKRRPPKERLGEEFISGRCGGLARQDFGIDQRGRAAAFELRDYVVGGD